MSKGRKDEGPDEASDSGTSTESESGERRRRRPPAGRARRRGPGTDPRGVRATASGGRGPATNEATRRRSSSGMSSPGSDQAAGRDAARAAGPAEEPGDEHEGEGRDAEPQHDLTGTVWGPSVPADPRRADGRKTGSSRRSRSTRTTAMSSTWARGRRGMAHDRGGARWTPIFDRQLSLGMAAGAIAIDPNDTSIIYVGTRRAGDAPAQAGLYKSTDGGASCVRVGFGYPAGNTATQPVRQPGHQVIIVDPADSQNVYLASRSGVFWSNDGGLNWTQGVGLAGDARSLVLDASSPANARILYAGVSRSGVFRSTTAGGTGTRS